MTRRLRRGTAPLEFALVLPLLLVITAVGWWAGQAGFVRVRTATDARQRAWEKRDECLPGVAYDLAQDPLVSYREETCQNVVPRRSPITGTNDIASAYAGVTDKTHDHLQFEFPKLPEKIAPHTKRIEHFGLFVPRVAWLAPALDGYAQMDPRHNGRLIRYRVEGEEWRVRRTRALASIASNLYSMIAAAIALRVLEVEAIASWNFPAAAKYDREARVVETGIPAAFWLLTRAVTN